MEYNPLPTYLRRDSVGLLPLEEDPVDIEHHMVRTSVLAPSRNVNHALLMMVMETSDHDLMKILIKQSLTTASTITAMSSFALMSSKFLTRKFRNTLPQNLCPNQDEVDILLYESRRLLGKRYASYPDYFLGDRPSDKTTWRHDFNVMVDEDLLEAATVLDEQIESQSMNTQETMPSSPTSSVVPPSAQLHSPPEQAAQGLEETSSLLAQVLNDLGENAPPNTPVPTGPLYCPPPLRRQSQSRIDQYLQPMQDPRPPLIRRRVIDLTQD